MAEGFRMECMKLILTGCAISPPETHTSVEWSDVVVWNDKT
jgi:hypothetical protein